MCIRDRYIFAAIDFSPTASASRETPLNTFFDASSLRTITLLFFMISISIRYLQFHLDVSAFVCRVICRKFLESQLFICVYEMCIRDRSCVVSSHDLLIIVLFIGILVSFTPFLGKWLASVLMGRQTWLSPVLGPV